MNRPARWIAMAALIVFPWQLYGERALSRVVTYSDMSMILGDKTLKNRRIELVSDKGIVAQGKLAGFSDGAVLLEAAPAVPLCGIALVRLSRNVASPLRRFAGIVGGVAAGSLMGSTLAFSVGSGRYDRVAMVMFLAPPIVGGSVGYKLVAHREDTVYLVDPVKRVDCTLLPLSNVD